MAFFSTTRIGISIEDDTLVICQIEYGSYQKTAYIRSIGTAAIPSGIFKEGHIADTEKLKELILETMEKAQPKAIMNRELIFELPEGETFHALLELPKEVPKEQMMEAVLLEAEKVLPFSVDQMSWDSKIIHHNGKNNTIYFSASSHDLVQEYYDFFQSCGLQALGFSTRIENLLNVVSKEKAQPSVLIDLQQDYSSVLFFMGPHLLSANQISIGEKELKKVIEEHYDLNKQKIESQLKTLSLVDINLATVHIMKKFEEELNALVNEYQRKEKEYKRHQKERTTFIPSENDEKKNTNPEKLKEIPEKKKLTAEELLESYSDSNEKYRFLFTGHFLLGTTIKEFFRQNTNPNLHELQTDLDQILTIKGVTPEVTKAYFLKSTGKKHSSSKMKKNEKILLEKLNKNINSAEKNVLHKLLPSTIGAALADFSDENKEKRPLNLLPKIVRAIALWKKTSSWFYVMATIMLVFSVTWLMAFGFTWGQTLAQLRTANQNFILVERQLSSKKPLTLEDKIQNANSELQKIRSLKSTSLKFSDIINDVKSIISNIVEIKALQYGLLSDSSLLELKGVANNREKIIDTYELIKILPFVNNVIFPASNFNQRNGEREFSLQFNLKSLPNTPSNIQ